MGLAVAVFTALLLVIPTLATAVPIDLSERVLYTGPLRFQVEAICLDGDCVGETFVSDTVILGRARVQDAGGGNWEILFEAIDRDRQLGFAANLWPAPVPNEIVTAGVEIPKLLLPGFESFAGLADGSVDVRVGGQSGLHGSPAVHHERLCGY